MADGTQFETVEQVIEHLIEYELSGSVPVGYEVRNMLICLAREIAEIRRRMGEG